MSCRSRPCAACRDVHRAGRMNCRLAQLCQPSAPRVSFSRRVRRSPPPLDELGGDRERTLAGAASSLDHQLRAGAFTSGRPVTPRSAPAGLLARQRLSAVMPAAYGIRVLPRNPHAKPSPRYRGIAGPVGALGAVLRTAPSCSRIAATRSFQPSRCSIRWRSSCHWSGSAASPSAPRFK